MTTDDISFFSRTKIVTKNLSETSITYYLPKDKSKDSVLEIVRLNHHVFNIKEDFDEHLKPLPPASHLKTVFTQDFNHCPSFSLEGGRSKLVSSSDLKRHGTKDQGCLKKSGLKIALL